MVIKSTALKEARLNRERLEFGHEEFGDLLQVKLDDEESGCITTTTHVAGGIVQKVAHLWTPLGPGPRKKKFSETGEQPEVADDEESGTHSTYS